MHELSIAVDLVDAATTRALECGADSITCIFLKVGALTGVIPAALTAAFEIASAETMAEGARLEIEDVPAALYCAVCDREQPVDVTVSFCCPVCGTASGDFRRGRELEVTSMEILEAVTT